MIKKTEVKLYDADSLEYAGSIIVMPDNWEYKDVNDDHLIAMTKLMPIKGVLSSLISFNYVYDIIEQN